MDTDFKRAEMSIEENTDTAGVLVPLTSEEDSTAELKAMLGKGCPSYASDLLASVNVAIGAGAARAGRLVASGSS